LTWQQANHQAAIESSNLHGELGLSIERPIDVFAAIERLGIVLAFAPMDKCSGVYIPASRPRSLAGILIHQGHPRSRQRFTAAHELGHHVFGHEFEIDTDLEQRFFRNGYNSVSDREKQAEAFATWFLMPRRLLRAGMRELELSLEEPAEVYALSLWLGTSYQATVRQLETTRILDVETAAEWRSVEPRTIKLGLIGNNDMDLRRDVWWIDHTTTSNPIDVRPGDRLIVRLPENATTGYSWRPAELSPDFKIDSDSFDDWWEPSRGEPSTPMDAHLVGQTTMRSLLLSVAFSTPASVQRLSFDLVQPWADDPPVDHYEILLSVTPSAHGIQVGPGELAVGA
jgi:Zn-dependent peptidase ImmA (M78 family)